MEIKALEQMQLPEPKRRPMNLPDDTQRLVIVGTTGSGKTHAGMWHLAHRNFDSKPWVVYDWKEDPLINSVDGTFPLDVNAPAPTNPGLYIVHPRIEDDDEAVSEQMKDIWNKEDIGVYVDESYLIAKSNSNFRALLCQGRSRHIPMIMCTQRPVWVDRFVFTESEFKQVFRLQSNDDHLKLADNMPKEDLIALTKRCPLRGAERRYWSYYYDGPEDDLRPVPPLADAAVIRSMFHAKLAKLKRVV